MASITHQSQNYQGTRSRPIVSFGEQLQIYRPVLYLFGLAVVGGLIYGLVFVRIANLFTLYDKPRLNLYTLPRGGEHGLYQLILAFLVLAIIYAAGWHLAQRVQGKAAWAVVFGGSLVFGMVLLLMYPYGATDLFDNVLRGRILGIYGGNPFLPGTARYSSDPFYAYIGWKGWPSAYGPLWELSSSLTARLAGNGVTANVLAYKILPGIFLLASVALVAWILHEYTPRHALAGALLLAWNPIVLYETWGNGHNDMAMVFWMILAMLLVFKQRYTLALLALVSGALFKFIPVLLFPPVFILGLRAQFGFRRRIIFIMMVAFLSLLFVAVAYAPFWEGVKVLNIQSRENLYTSSIPAVIFNTLVTQDWPRKAAAALVSHGALALLALFVLWRSWKVWKAPSFDTVLNSSVLILLFYLLVTCLWFQNWYSLWPIGLAPLLKPGPIRRTALLFGLLTLSKPLGVGPVLFWPHPELDQPWLEIWLTLGVMGIPWLYSLFNIWKAKHENVPA